MQTQIMASSDGYEMGEINETSTEMAENWMPSIDRVDTGNTKTAEYRLKELQHILSDTAADRARIDQAQFQRFGPGAITTGAGPCTAFH